MEKYIQSVHNQNRLISMKKISLFILFALAILRGPQLSAQVCDSVNFTVNYAGCSESTTPLTITYPNGGITYTFKLDSVASATNSWQNVRPGNHTISYTGSNGCTSRTYYRYLSSNQPQFGGVRFLYRASCLANTASYLIGIRGGQSPYYLNINGVSAVPQPEISLMQGRNTIKITDANGCVGDTIYTAIFPPFDSVRTTFTFVPNSTCDSVGTLTISAIDRNLPRPFSISLAGQPYVNDSVLRNVRLLNGNTPFLLKTPNGCVYNGIIRSFRYNSPNFTINYTSCGSPAPLSINYTIQNGVTYAFRLDGVASPNNTWQNVLPGRHTLGYTSSNGCSRADSTPILLGSTASIGIYATEQKQQRTCVDSVRLFRLTAYGGQAPYSFEVNNNPAVATEFVYLKNTFNYITVQDANGCRSNRTIVPIEFQPDSIVARQTFVPNTTCDSLGNLKISVNDPNLQGPLSMSLDGVTYTTDSVFRNINIYYQYNYQYVYIRTAQGCIYKINRIYNSREQQYLRCSYDYNSSCNQPATLTVNVYNPSNSPYVLRLDGVASATNTWQNVAPGRYTFGYTINGCSSIDTVINLRSNNSLYVHAEQQPLRACSDTLYSFKLKVSGGRAPYTFRIDNGAATTDTIVFLREGLHYITVVDALGCRSNSDSIYNYVYIEYFRDSVSATTTFTPNTRCGDSIGTLKISVNSPNIARPFTISLNGGAFTSDTVFQNVVYNYGYLPFTVKSAQGCLYSGFTDYYNANRLQISMYDSCANRFGRGTVSAYVYSFNGTAFSFQWNNGSTSTVLRDVPIGTYSVTATDANGCSVTASKTLTTCVWPGDTDTSGVVNANDLLNIGLAFGERGLLRPYCEIDSSNLNGYCTSWQPFNVPFWSKQTATNVNFKHIDADGNGIINHKDTLTITRNWLKIRNLRDNSNPLEVRGAAPPIFVQTGRVVEGQWASFPIMLGDATNAANGVYGLAFSINYDASVIDASTVYLTYNQNWLGSGDNVVRISKNFNGSIDAAISRTNQQNSSGNGQIATLNFKIKTGMSGRNLAFSVDNQQVINRDAQTVPTVSTPTSTTVLTATSEPDWARQIDVYPNPTTGNVNIEGQNLEIKSVEVFDISGKSLLKSENIGRGGPLSIARAGTYFLKILTERGVLMRKVVKL